jgi:hypothetical protein
LMEIELTNVSASTFLSSSGAIGGHIAVDMAAYQVFCMDGEAGQRPAEVSL